jgi:hypothetical protein
VRGTENKANVGSINHVDFADFKFITTRFGEQWIVDESGTSNKRTEHLNSKRRRCVNITADARVQLAFKRTLKLFGSLTGVPAEVANARVWLLKRTATAPKLLEATSLAARSACTHSAEQHP